MPSNRGTIGSPPSLIVTENYDRDSQIVIESGVLGISYTRTFTVLTPDTSVGAWYVLNNDDIPTLGTPYLTSTEHDDYAYVKSLSAKQDGESNKWLVTVVYGQYDLKYNDPDPISNLPRPSWSFAKYEREADIDAFGNPVLNSALDPFDPTIKRDDSRMILTIQRNEPSFNYTTAYNLRDTLNLNQFYQFAPLTMKVCNITAEVMWNPIIGQYWNVSYIFEFNPNTWNSQPLDQGLRELIGTTQQNIYVNGEPATAPVNLDGSGNVLPKDPSDPVNNAIYLNYQIYNAVDYGTAFNFSPFMDLGEGPGV